jgi:hypothetical protein
MAAARALEEDNLEDQENLIEIGQEEDKYLIFERFRFKVMLLNYDNS